METLHLNLISIFGILLLTFSISLLIFAVYGNSNHEFLAILSFPLATLATGLTFIHCMEK